MLVDAINVLVSGLTGMTIPPSIHPNLLVYNAFLLGGIRARRRRVRPGRSPGRQDRLGQALRRHDLGSGHRQQSAPFQGQPQ